MREVKNIHTRRHIMKEVKPRVFLVGETRIIPEGMQSYLEHIGAPHWDSNAQSDAEKLTEFYGKLCYKSFAIGLNPNIRKVRESNKEYIDHVIEVGHGSVMEHAVINFVFADVSRVFTHELVRHRTGVAISQESLRFVRLEDLGQWLPTVICENEQAVEIFARTFEELERLQLELAQIFELDSPGKPFYEKKVITSAMRRLAPIGLATTIGWSANPRTIRWVLEMRTDPAAEEEIRLVFGKVGRIVTERYPHLFGDLIVELVDGLPCYRSVNSKI